MSLYWRTAQEIPSLEMIGDKSPVRLRDPKLTVPDNTELVVIGVNHDISAGSPDYLREIFEETRVFGHEQFAWTEESRVKAQEISDGNKDTLAEHSALTEMLRNRDLTIPGNARAYGDAAWWNGLYKALLGTRNHVVMTDLPNWHYAVESGNYLEAEQRILTGMGSEKDYKVFALREKYMARMACEGIINVQSTYVDLSNDGLLPVAMVVGGNHVASLAGTLTEAAKEQNVDDLFIEVAVDAHNFHSDSMSPAIAAYQQWLRSEV